MMTNMKSDPTEIAEHLIQDNGVDGAIQAAQNGATKAQQDGDNYTLSVWREVKAILREKTS